MNKRYQFISNEEITKPISKYDKIMQPEIAIHCNTEEKANNLLKWAHSKGLTWRSGISYLDENCYDMHKLYHCFTYILI